MTTRHLRFEKSMLNGHPNNVTLAVKRVIVRIVNHGLVVTSTTDGRHAPTSFHFTQPGRAVDAGHDPQTVSAVEGRRRKEEFQRDLLRRGARHFDELFGPINNACVKNGVQITLVEGTALEENHDTHVHVVPRTVFALPQRPKLSDLDLARLAKKHGANYSLRIVWEARCAGIPVELGFALIEQESGFRNVWGGDPAPNGGTTGLQFKPVTRDRYLAYKKARGAKGEGGMQGVGPAQLTWFEFQDDADRLGGCHVPRHNIRVAFARLSALIRLHGHAKGIARYNGSGPAAERYSREVRAKQDRWQDRLTA